MTGRRMREVATHRLHLAGLQSGSDGSRWSPRGPLFQFGSTPYPSVYPGLECFVRRHRAIGHSSVGCALRKFVDPW